VDAVRQGRLRFRTRRPLQRHDGLQIDLPSLGKPFGFAVDRLWVLSKKRETESYEAPANALVEVALPAEHPDLPVGAPVYCSSSQIVKQKYRFEKPKPGLWHVRQPLHISAALSAQELTVIAMIPAQAVRVQHSLPGPFAPAQDVDAMAKAARGVFERLGNSP